MDAAQDSCLSTQGAPKLQALVKKGGLPPAWGVSLSTWLGVLELEKTGDGGGPGDEVPGPTAPLKAGPPSSVALGFR